MFFGLCIGFILAAGFKNSQSRERLLMDFNWRFTLGDPADAGGQFDYPEQEKLHKTEIEDRQLEAELAAKRIDAAAVNLGGDVSYVQPDFNDKKWRKLDLPHDWVVELPFDGNNVSHGRKGIDPAKGTNIGWYRRTFNLAKSDKGKILWVEFDGVYRNCLVWINGHCLGRHTSGYSSFYYDITKFAKFGGKNVLAVRVDATREEGWFYEGGGIYRRVWLVKLSPVHIGHWGTFVTSEVSEQFAEVTAETTLRNDSEKPAVCKLITNIVDADGKTIAESSEEFITLEPASEKIIEKKIKISEPILWSLENPYLYRLISSVESGKKAADSYETVFGIRTIKWDANEGFLLNGKKVVIKGTCNHQDHAGVGSAVPDRLNEWRIERLKEMGCNAYRSSHNPPTPELLDACDRLGMLVMDENRRFDTTPEILGQLERLILRDRNHPSVVIWSLGNEEFGIQGEEIGEEICRTMQDLVHKLDPTRPATVAMNGDWGKGFSKVIDVMGFNYYSSKDNNADEYHKNFPATPCVGSEEASTLCTRGCYAKDANAGFMSAYDKEGPEWGSTAEEWWNYYTERPWIAGGFVWTGFDYRGEPTPYDFAYSTQFGIMDTCGFAKDNFYYYQAWWSDKTVLHILPHWNWAGREGEKIEVWVHSNCDEVELLLNGKSLGRKIMKPNSHLEWMVLYESGVLLAKGYMQGKLAAQNKVETTGGPYAVVLIPDRAEINGNGEDVSIITAAAVDKDGRTVPVADNEINFSIRGGKIIGIGNGNPNTTESDKQPKRKLFNGLAQVIVQSGKKAGIIELTAESAGLKSCTLKIKARRCGMRMAVP